MLDAFGNGSGTKKAQKTANDDFQALINSAREERSALSEMLTQVTSRGSKLAQTHKALEQIEKTGAGTLGRVDELGRRLASLDEHTSALEEEKLGVIMARKKLVDEVEVKTQMITNLLADVRVNLETLGEQKSVVDHISEKLARLDFVTREAQNTLASLQRERELAERIEHGIKQLRSRSMPVPVESKTA